MIERRGEKGGERENCRISHHLVVVALCLGPGLHC